MSHGPVIDDFELRLAEVHARIEAAWQRARAEDPDRAAPSLPRLIAVTKRHPLAAIRAARAAGVLDVGENYAQEFRDKFNDLAASDGPPLRWHFIGQLQRNKVKYVVGRALVHTVDRIELVDALQARAERDGVTQELLVELNDGESQKGGVAPERLGALLDHIAKQSALRCRGLMTMAPLGDAAAARDCFRRCADLRQREASKPRSNVDLRELSMGMSGDFELAIAEGATMVRVGSALFGPRPT